MTTEYTRTMENLAKPFVASGIYESTEAFVNDIVKDVASRRIKSYERKIRRYETKYGSFEAFSRKISGKATPAQEDLWMDWEASLNMLKAWKFVTSRLDSNAS